MVAWAKPSTIMPYTTILIVQYKPSPIESITSSPTMDQQIHYFVQCSCTKQQPHTGPMSQPQTCSKWCAKQSQASTSMKEASTRTS